MTQFMITYLGSPKPTSPEQGQQHFAKYKAWLADLGDAAVSPANPLKNITTVAHDGSVSDSSTTTMSGFTIIEAESHDAALVIARKCPYLELGGSLEVSEIVNMNG